MTPRPLDVATVQTKLRLIQDLLDDLAAAGQVTGDALRGDRLLRHALERVLTQLVDLAVQVNSHVVAAQLGRAPNSYRQSFHDAVEAGLLTEDLADRLAPAVGLRNILTHEYATVNVDHVAAAVPRACADVADYVRSVAQWLATRD